MPSFPPGTRPSVEEVWLGVARQVSEWATCPRLHVGAVIVDAHGHIVSTGYNGAPRSLPHCTEVGCLIEPETGRCKRTVHGEVNAMLQAGQRARGSTLYLTHMPCGECTNLILNIGLVRVVYEKPYAMPFAMLEARLEMYREAGVELYQWEEEHALHLRRH